MRIPSRIRKTKNIINEIIKMYRSSRPPRISYKDQREQTAAAATDGHTWASFFQTSSLPTSSHAMPLHPLPLNVLYLLAVSFVVALLPIIIMDRCCVIT